MQRQFAIRALVAATLGIAGTCAAFWPTIASAQSTSIPGAASYSCDFENGYCDFAEQSAIGDAPPSTLRRSAIIAPGRSGSYAVRLHTEPGDSNVHGSGTWERDDLAKAPDASYCNQGQEEWWAVSMLYPSDYSFPAPGQGGVFIDFHHNSDSGLPNFSVEARGESGLRISGYGGAQLNGGQYRVQIPDPYGAVNNVTRNAWYDYVFHIKWSSNGDGLSEAWLNGKKILSYSGATLYSGISCYLKIANYHDATGQPSSIIYDRVVRGASAVAVAMGQLEGVDGAPSTVPAVTTPPPATSPAPAPGGAGSPASATMDSSSYTVAAGQSVTFTARILGNGATPTGSVSFASDGTPIGGCSSVMLSSGSAQCNTSSLPGGPHQITAAYSGDSTYGPATAGPITQSVNGSAPSSVALPTSFRMDSSSYTSVSGQSVTFTATIPGSGGTVAFKDNGANISGCGASAVSAGGIATCMTASLPAGTHSITGVYSGNGSYSAGIAGPITQAVVPGAVQTATAAPSLNVQGLWWGGPSESGWGLNLVQQGSIIFATWFTYDAQGRGQWLVMPNGAMTGPDTYGGTLYRTTGPAFTAAAFDPANVSAVPVGDASFDFSDANHGTFAATVDGLSLSKAIVRETFDPRVPTCAEEQAPGASANYQDLWWRAGGTEAGWGVNLAHQGDTIFMTWFTYDVDGRGMWLVASNLAKDDAGGYSGTLYRTTGPAFGTAQWDPSQVMAVAVGTASLSFPDSSDGSLAYSVNGVSGSKPIAREVFAAPPTVCRAS